MPNLPDQASPEINANRVHTPTHTHCSADKAPHALTFRAFSQHFYPEQLNKNICQKKEEQQYVAVSTVEKFIEQSKTQLLG